MHLRHLQFKLSNYQHRAGEIRLRGEFLTNLPVHILKNQPLSACIAHLQFWFFQTRKKNTKFGQWAGIYRPFF